MAQTGTVTASKLNFRSSPDPAGNVIRQLPRGTQVEVIEDLGEWLKVSVGGQTGFVSETFVSVPVEGPDDDDATVGGAASLSGGASASAGSAASSSQPAPVGQPASSGQTLNAGPAPAPGRCSFSGANALTPDGKIFAKKFRLGVFNFGQTSIGTFVAAHRDLFPNISPSRLRVMQAVSANEGKLEAINTWDSAILTFGCFQWTVGGDAGPAELPTMIDRLKRKDASVFQKYFGQFGLDTVIPPAVPNTLPTGFFSLNGTTLRTPQQKAQLRGLDWAYRFWLSGQDDTVRMAEVEHAMARVDLFFRCPRCLINTRFVGDYVSSEYGVALLLDEHVNRPGHVPGTLARAVSSLVAQLGADAPQGWQDAQEQRLLDLYVANRALTNMTNSNERAATIRQAVAAGLASNRRGSFQA